MIATETSIKKEIERQSAILEPYVKDVDVRMRQAQLNTLQTVHENIDYFQRLTKVAWDNHSTNVSLFGDNGDHTRRLFRVWNVRKQALTYFQKRHRMILAMIQRTA